MGCVISGPDVAVAAPQPQAREDPPRPERGADRERGAGGGGRGARADRLGHREREHGGDERKGKEMEKEKQQKPALVSTSVVTWEAGRVPSGVPPHFVPARCGPFATDEAIPPQTPAVGGFVVCLGDPAVAADGTTPASPIPPRMLPPGVADAFVFRASHSASVPGARGVGAVIHDGSNLLPFAAANGDALDAGAPLSLRGFFPSAMAGVCVGVARPAVEVTSLARNGFVCREEVEAPDAATARRRRRLFLYPYRVRAIGLFVSGSATVTRAAEAHAGACQSMRGNASASGDAIPGAFATWVFGERVTSGELGAVAAVADRQRAAVACYAPPPAPKRTEAPKRVRRQKVVDGPEGESLVPASSDDATSSSDGDDAELKSVAAVAASAAATMGSEWVPPSASQVHPSATRETSFGFTLAAPTGFPRSLVAAARLNFAGAPGLPPVEAAWARFIADLPVGRHTMTLELRFEYPAGIYHAVWTGARKQQPLVASADGRDINISGAPLKRVGVFVRAGKSGSSAEPGHVVSDALASATLLLNVTQDSVAHLRARATAINTG